MIQRRIECEEGEVAADPRAPPTARWACDCDSLPKTAGACDNPRSRWGVILFPGTSHEGSISSRSLALSFFRGFRTVPAVRSPVLERTEIAKYAGVGKFEGDDIAPVVEGLATGTNPHGRGQWCRRGTEAGNGYGGGRQRHIDGCRCDGSGLRRSLNARRDGRRGVMGRQGGRMGRVHLLG